MQLSISHRGVLRSAGAGQRHNATRSLVVARKPCKPVCFKDKDSIDDSTASQRTPTASTTTGGSAPSSASAPELLPFTTAGLRPVNLGPVGSLMFPALQYGTIAAAAAAILAPGPVGSALFKGAAMSGTTKGLLVMAAAALIPSIISKRQIKRAADTGTLASPVFKQLVSGCLLHGVMALVVLSQAVSLRNPVLAATVGGLAGLAVITTSYTIMKIRESGQLAPSTRGLLTGVVDLLTPANAVSFAYSALTTASLVVGTMLFLSDPSTACPVFYEAKDAVHVFATRIAGAATLGNAVMMFTVKGAADNGRQGSPVYRNINGAMAAWGGLTAAAIAYALATGLAMPSPVTWGFLTFYGLTALVTGYSWASAPPSTNHTANVVAR